MMGFNMLWNIEIYSLELSTIKVVNIMRRRSFTHLCNDILAHNLFTRPVLKNTKKHYKKVCNGCSSSSSIAELQYDDCKLNLQHELLRVYWRPISSLNATISSTSRYEQKFSSASAGGMSDGTKKGPVIEIIDRAEGNGASAG